MDDAFGRSLCVSGILLVIYLSQRRESHWRRRYQIDGSLWSDPWMAADHSGIFLGCIIGSVIHLIRIRVSGAGHMLAMGPYLSAGIL